jgi:hypothetical protein
MQHAVMVDPAPVSTLKGAALSFLEGNENLNLDPIDDDQ